MEFRDKEDPGKGQPEDPFNKANEEPEDTGQPDADDLEAYFGDPDGGDNITDHGTPRREEEPEAEEGEPAEEPAEEEVVEEEEEVEEPVESQEEPPAEEEKYKIKVQGEEIEVTQEELIEFAQKGKDYTQKTQALAEREKRITGYEGLVNLIDRDPRFRQHVQEYDPHRIASPTPEPEVKDPLDIDLGEAPEDPVERVKWEAKKEVLDQMKPAIQSVREDIASVRKSVQNVAPQVKREVDPYGEATQAALHAYLKNLPPHTAQSLYNQWDTDPVAYQEAFGWMREKVVKHAESMHDANQDEQVETTPEGEAPTAQPKKQPTKKVERKVTERAPVLESSGAAHVEATQADRSKKIKTLHSRIRNQEYDHRDVGALFDLIDPID